MLNLKKEAVWLKTVKVEDFPRFGNKKIDNIDVCIIGSGITGLSCALKLYEQGKKFILLDANKIAHGVSLNTSAKVTSLHRVCYSVIIKKYGLDIAKIYAEMNEGGLNNIRNNIKKYNINCHWGESSHTVYTINDDGIKSIQEEVEACNKVGLKAEYLQKIEELPFETKAACRVYNQGYFNPYEYLIQIAKFLEKQGCEIYENSRVVDISFMAPHEIKTLDGGYIKANHVILATQLPILDRSGHFASCHPKNSYCIALTLNNNNNMIKDMYISDDNQGNGNKSLRPVGFKDENNDDILLVGGNGHPVGEPSNNNTEYEYKELIDWSKKHFNVKNIICGWSAHDYIPDDFLPYIGYLHYGTNSLYCATGYKKWGFSQASASGIIITDLIMNGNKLLDNKNSWHAVFDARRWDLTKSIKEFVSFQLFVAKHFFKDRIEDSKYFNNIVDVEDLSTNCGGICKDKGNVIGAYKDEHGVVHKVSYVCTHLGCHVRWNQAEKTWDCPCHGSRFDIDGNVLQGPTVKNLIRYE